MLNRLVLTLYYVALSSHRKSYKMNKITERKDNEYICKQSSDVKIDWYLLAIVLYWIVTEKVIKMNKITERKDNEYICKQSSDVKID